jgi:hypothetical protein
MISIAARATRGAKIPDRKQTRKEIIRIFKEQMQALKERLNVHWNYLVSLNHYYPNVNFRASLLTAKSA